MSIVYFNKTLFTKATGRLDLSTGPLLMLSGLNKTKSIPTENLLRV
jgi:hypothetical protein